MRFITTFIFSSLVLVATSFADSSSINYVVSELCGATAEGETICVVRSKQGTRYLSISKNDQREFIRVKRKAREDTIKITFEYTGVTVEKRQNARGYEEVLVKLRYMPDLPGDNAHLLIDGKLRRSLEMQKIVHPSGE